MKKILSFGLALALLLAGAGPCLAESTPIIYRVTDEAGHRIYLMGTVHLGNEDMYPLGGAFEEVWQASELLAVEGDTLAVQENMGLALKYAQAMMYGADDSAKNHLSEEAYALGLEKLGQPALVMDRMKPMAWSSLAETMVFSQMGYDAEMGVDTVLLRRAREEGKPIVELEGLDAQLAMMDAVPDEVADELILQSLRNVPAAALGLTLLVNAWRQGNEETFDSLIRESRQAYPEDRKDLFEQYDRLLYSDRNVQFAQQAEAYLQSGQTVLIAIGSAHVIGEGTVSQLLRDAGYTVERME